MSMTQEEQAKSAQIAAAADKFIATKEEMRDALNDGGVSTPATLPFVLYPERVEALGKASKLATVETLSGVCFVDIELNCASGYEIPSGSTEKAELLNGAYVAVMVSGVLNPIKAEVTSLENFRKRIVIPLADGESLNARVMLRLGPSETCAYHATPLTFTIAPGEAHTAVLQTVQMSGTGTVVEVARIQPYTSTANDSGDSWIAQKVTSAAGTRFHVGYYDSTGAFVKDAGIKVGVWTVPAGAESLEQCTENLAYGNQGDTDIFTLLKVLGEEKIVDVTYTGDNSATVANKFVRFSQVYVKTTYENIEIPVHDASGNTISTTTIACVCRWFCNTQADADYHLHSAFIRYVRNGDTYDEEVVPYAYVSRYPINNVSLTCGGASYSMAKSQADSSQEVGNTRAGFLDRCRNVNHAAITVSDPATGTVLHTLAANADSRAMSMIDLGMISLIEDLAYLLFGVDAQSQLRGVSVDTTDAKAQQVNGTTDFIANLGIKLGGRDPHSAYFNFNFLDIEGGTWSAPGCMFPNFTSIMERITTTDASGVPTSITRNRYIVAIDRLDYNPGSSDVDNLTANGYRYVSFLVGSNRRIGLDDTQMMRDAKLFTSAATTKNVNYAGVDNHWQGTAPSAIAAYSASTTYAENAYAIYDGKLYRCTTAVQTAEAFDSEKWTLVTSETIVARSCVMVARGFDRHHGASLGAVTLNAIVALSHSHGYYWRSRLSYQPLPSANDE